MKIIYLFVELVIVLLMIVYFVVLFIHLVGEILKIRGKRKIGLKIRFVTKPLFVPILLLLYILNNPNVYIFVILALSFGFTGDVLLMITETEEKELFFKSGLLSFAIGHIFYGLSFLIIHLQTSKELSGLSFMVMVFYIGMTLSLTPLFVRRADDFRVFVLIYIIIIFLMGISSTLIYSLLEPLETFFLIGGVSLFMFSDGVIAFNKFVKKIVFERLITMTTYTIAQLFLILTFLRI